MDSPQHFDYVILLVFPGFGPERENAEAVVENALDWLNDNKSEPGFRFAAPVFAHLETVSDAAAARDRLEADERVATVILHGLDDRERDELARVCDALDVGVCATVDAPRSAGPRDQPWRLILRDRPSGEVPHHRLCAETLTAPVGDDRDTAGRVEEVIAVLALGVMMHHFRKNPPPVFEGTGPPPGTGGPGAAPG
jgi:hypothetical protein